MEPSRSSSKDLALMTAFILIASLDSVYKYTGFAGMICYVVAASAFLYLYFRKIFPVLVDRVPLTASVAASVVSLVGLGALAFFLHGLANDGRFGPGSDADDALIIGATELLNGRYPFYPLTYLNNPIAPMPGAVIFAVPFVLAGIYPLQNVFWLAAFFVIVGIWSGSFRRTLFMALPVLAVSPTVFQNLASGTDHIANSVYILLFSLLVIRAAWKQEPRWWEYAVPALLLGIGLSSRSNFAFIVPMLFILLWKVKDLRTGIWVNAVIGVSFAAVTLPFFLYDPQGFTPLIVQTEKMKQFNGIIPQAGVILAMLALVLALVLSLRKVSERVDTFYQNMAFVQLFILTFTSTLFSIWIGRFDLYFGHIGYGLFVMFFGVFANWIRLSLPGRVWTNAA